MMQLAAMWLISFLCRFQNYTKDQSAATISNGVRNETATRLSFGSSSVPFLTTEDNGRLDDRGFLEASASPAPANSSEKATSPLLIFLEDSPQGSYPQEAAAADANDESKGANEKPKAFSQPIDLLGPSEGGEMATSADSNKVCACE